MILLLIVEQYETFLIRPKLSAASPTNRPQPKAIITRVIIKLKLWLATGCEAKVVAELSSHTNACEQESKFHFKTYLKLFAPFVTTFYQSLSHFW